MTKNRYTIVSLQQGRTKYDYGGIVMGKGWPFGKRTPDRTERNQSDGQVFYGFDNEDGTTDWYDKRGSMDSTTKTPHDEDDD